MGIELNASDLNYVLIDVDENHDVSIVGANRLALADTRSRSALAAFQSALLTTLNDAAPTLIAVKSKPESGQMRAGAAALKMEGLLLANASCEVLFVSGARVNKVTDTADGLYAYLQPAYKAALAAAQ